MKILTRVFTVISVLFLLILSAIVLIYFSRNKNQAEIPSPKQVTKTPQPTDTLVGGDRDEHGCIGSAGYTWCEPKDKCLRIWEEKCYESVSQEIQYLLANKYDKNPSEVFITITKETAEFAAGSVKFGQGGIGESGLFLARKVGNIWEIVFDGNGSIDCTKMRQDYNFPDEILKPNFCD